MRACVHTHKSESFESTGSLRVKRLDYILRRIHNNFFTQLKFDYLIRSPHMAFMNKILLGSNELFIDSLFSKSISNMNIIKL